MTEKKSDNHESMAMPEVEDLELSSDTGKSKKLTLDKKSIKPSKTRSELYNELKKKEEKQNADLYQFSPVADRGLSLVIDAAFVFALIKLVIITAPLELKVIHFFLEKYQLQLLLGDARMIKVLMWTNSFLFLFFFTVIPVAFFNCSLGKKIIGLRVRGDDIYTISITKAFQRELIFKPISIACLVGLIMPFFSKEKRSLHDKVCGTLVIKD